MTDPSQAQPPPQPTQQGFPGIPPQPQPDPSQEYQPQPTGFITATPPSAKDRKPLIVAATAFVAVLFLAFGGYAVYDGFIKEDSGVAACKAMRDGKQADGSPKESDDDKMTEAEYREARGVFEDSRHEDIRKHGTALMDLAWQISQLPEGQEMGAIAFIGPMGTHVSGLQTACADQGVIVNLNQD